MKTSISSIFLLALTVQSIVYADKSHDSTRNEIDTTVKPNAVGRVIGRNDGSMMNMSASAGQGNNRNDNALDNMFKIFMMCKTFISTALMFIDPIFKVKNFIISAIMTFIAVAKFVMDLKNSKSNEKKESWGVGSYMIGGEDRIGMSYGTAYRPSYFAHYPTYMHKYRVQS